MNLKLNAGTLPTSCYPSSPQQLYNSMFSLGSALAPDLTGVVISDTTPSANDQDKAWIKTNAGDPVYPFPFVYSNGAWLAPHPCPAASDERRLWVGTAGDITLYDGGDSGTAGIASGPMWAIDDDFAAKFLVGPGTMPSTATVTVGTNGGNETHVLTQAELPDLNFRASIKAGQADNLDSDNSQVLCSNDAAVNPYTLEVPSGGSGTAFSLLPPYRGIYVIKRTARIYYRGA